METLNYLELIEKDLLKINGRYLIDKNNNCLMFYFSLSGFEFNFFGKNLKIEFFSTNYKDLNKEGYAVIFIDDKRYDFLLDEELKIFKINLEAKKHLVKVYKRNEALDSYFGLRSLKIDGNFLEKPKDKKYLMEIIGASTSCGYGVLGKREELKTTHNSDALRSPFYYAGLKLDCDFLCLNASGWGLIGSNWTNPKTLNLIDAYHALYLGDKNNEGFLSDLKYDYLHKRKSDIIILNFGTNDLSYIDLVKDNAYLKSLRIKQYINTYLFLIDFLKALNKDSKIFLIYGLMKEEAMYKLNEEVYQKLEDKKNVYLLKLEGDQLACGNHPSDLGNQKLGELLFEAIKKQL